MKASIKLAVLISLLLSFASCKNNKNNQQVAQPVDTTSISDEKFSEAKQIVYSLPSPQEVSMIILDNKELTFDPTITNNLANVNKYTTDLAKALNLGIYSADISYATIFNQKQTAVNYMSAAKSLAESLGILDYFTQDEIKEIEKNVTNRDEISKIISEAYMRSDAKLQEDKRDDIGALILIGGWVEGMYIATKLAQCNAKSNTKLVSSIMEQQLSLALLVDFLHYYSNNKLLSEIARPIFELDKIFQQANTDIDQDGNIIVGQKDFEKICRQIEKIRNTYVNMI